MSGNIFLNYRRDDSRWPTLSLYNLLAQVFPREQLFMGNVILSKPNGIR